MGPGLMVTNELLGCNIPNCAVRPFFIVFPPPRLHHKLRFLQRHKPVFVETFIPKLAVETLDERILYWLPGLNEVQMHAMLRRPGIECHSREFRPVIQDQRLRQRASQKHPIQNPAHPCPPIDTSTSITGTSLEHRSVIVKHLYRRPVTSRSCTKSSA